MVLASEGFAEIVGHDDAGGKIGVAVDTVVRDKLSKANYDYG